MKKSILTLCCFLATVLFCTNSWAGNTNKMTDINDRFTCYVYNIDELIAWEFDYETNLPCASSMTCNVCCVNAGIDRTLNCLQTSVIGSSCTSPCGGLPCPNTFSWSPSTYLSSTTVAQPTVGGECATGFIIYTLTVSHSSGCNGGCAQTTDQVRVDFTSNNCGESCRIGHFDTNAEVENKGINVFPNPSTGKITVQLDAVSPKTSIEVYGMDGKLVMKKNNLSEKDTSVEIDLSTYAKGMYYIQVLEGKTGILNKKVVIERMTPQQSCEVSIQIH